MNTGSGSNTATGTNCGSNTATGTSCGSNTATGSATGHDELGAYLDWAASTPIRQSALDVYLQASVAGFANPTGSHPKAQDARRIIDLAREQIADAVGAEPADVIFCGGGTEADNHAIYGVHSRRGGTVACGATEHHAVLHPVQDLGGDIICVDSAGRIDLSDLAAKAAEAKRSGASWSVFSAMLVNNETGVVNDLDAISEVLKEHSPETLLHTDAVQGFVWYDLSSRAKSCDLISISGHKFGGPKGVGALIVRNRDVLDPILRGGGQEFEKRSGTQNVAGIAALGAAVVESVAEREQMCSRVQRLHDELVAGLKAELDGVVETAVDGGTAEDPGEGSGACVGGGVVEKAPGIVHLCFEGIESEPLLFALSRQGICASAASSCASGAQDPSHVLAAMGYCRKRAGSSLRLSLGYASKRSDIERAIEVIPPIVQRLRSFNS